MSYSVESDCKILGVHCVDLASKGDILKMNEKEGYKEMTL